MYVYFFFFFDHDKQEVQYIGLNKFTSSKLKLY